MSSIRLSINMQVIIAKRNNKFELALGSTIADGDLLIFLFAIESKRI